MTVEEYVLLGAVPYLSFGAVPGRGWRARVAAVLSEMELSALAGCGMGEISGGERQRAALAQVLLTQAPFLLLDEPTAHLDVRRQHEFLQRLRGLSAQQGKGILVSVHDPNLALRYAERVAVLSKGGCRKSRAHRRWDRNWKRACAGVMVLRCAIPRENCLIG